MFSAKPRITVNDIMHKNICDIQTDLNRIEGIPSKSASPRS